LVISGLFATYSSHLIAGAIPPHREMMPQFDTDDSRETAIEMSPLIHPPVMDAWRAPLAFSLRQNRGFSPGPWEFCLYRHPPSLIALPIPRLSSFIPQAPSAPDLRSRNRPPTSTHIKIAANPATTIFLTNTTCYSLPSQYSTERPQIRPRSVSLLHLAHTTPGESAPEVNARSCPDCEPHNFLIILPLAL
jgi:hypothetical protein